MSIKAIVFDLDDTLVVDEAVTAEAFHSAAQLAATFGAQVDPFFHDSIAFSHSLWERARLMEFCRRIGISARECLWGNFDATNPSERELAEWALEYRIDVFDRALREQMIENPDAASQISERFAASRRKLQRLMPNALETLTRLAPDFQIGLLTNGASSLQREKIAASGLAGFFKEILVSGEENIGKPDPAVFEILLKRLKVSPQEALMVGNSLERDIAGANAAGIRSVWLEVKGSEEHHPTEPSHTIRSLSEVPALAAKPE